MNTYLLIDHIYVQNANAIAGFTWGFPAITHFLGFTHNLDRKLNATYNFPEVGIKGCAVISHEQHVHTYRTNYDFEFTQSRNPPYLASHKKEATPPVIEEGRMNMMVSLLIGIEGNIGNRKEDFIAWVRKSAFLQRLAGGTILDIRNIELIDSSETYYIRRKLLPGFVLMDRSDYLEAYHYLRLEDDPNSELLHSWMHFSALKYRARPKNELISRYLKNLDQKDLFNKEVNLHSMWNSHLSHPYGGDSNELNDIKAHFSKLEKTKLNKKLIEQWEQYITPNDKTDAEWDMLSKPNKGYLVPLMTGYKAISDVLPNAEVANTRDNDTDVCFVESVHTVGEWIGVHRLRTEQELNASLWHYHFEKDWYLCKQKITEEVGLVSTETDFTNEFE